VTDPLDSVLVALEQFGKANDASTTERARCMLNITRDTGEFLAVLVRATLARRVLEIGTSKRLFDTVTRERRSRDRRVCDNR
jgi:predicted O-methyltransferase YrrM